jgi:hypothetical protein
MENAITINNWSTTMVIDGGEPSLSLAGITNPDEDPRQWRDANPEHRGILTTPIREVVRTSDDVFVKTRNTWYKLGEIDPQFVEFCVVRGLREDQAVSLVEWATNSDRVGFTDTTDKASLQ